MKRMILLILLACGAASAATWQERVELYCVRNNVAGAVYGDNVFVSLEPSGPALVWRVAGVAAPALSDLPSEAETDAALYPVPDVTVPVIDADGNRTGTARLLVDETGHIIAVTDSASPQRPWADQKADAVSKLAALAAVKQQREADKATTDKGKKDLGKNLSVAELRAQVAILNEIVARLVGE